MPQLRDRNKIFLPVGLGFFLVGLGFSIWAARTWRFEHAFDNARVVDGVVEKAWMVTQRSSGTARGRRTGGDFHYVRFSYVVDGKTYTADQLVGAQFANAVSKGDTIPIYYQESNPAVAVAEKRHLNLFLLIFAVPFTLIGGGMLLASIPNFVSVILFNASAVATTGTVVSVSEYPLIYNGQQTWTVQYEFRDAKGHKHRAFSDPVLEPERFEQGDEVRVRYKRRDPETSELVSSRQVTAD